MPHLLRFTTQHVYDSRLDGITLEVFLNAGRGEPARLRAKVDTGASDCLFERQYADLLGLTVEQGDRRVFSTAAGRFLAFGHEVSVGVLGHEVVSMVYFFADDAVEKNVLGRRGWLDRVRLGIVDYESTLYLSAHHEA
jgi:hypothetical protein